MAKKKASSETKARSRSGTSSAYAERAARGRPTASFSLNQDTVLRIGDLAAYHGLSRSGVVELAVSELMKRMPCG